MRGGEGSGLGKEPFLDKDGQVRKFRGPNARLGKGSIW